MIYLILMQLILCFKHFNLIRNLLPPNYPTHVAEYNIFEYSGQ